MSKGPYFSPRKEYARNIIKGEISDACHEDLLNALKTSLARKIAPNIRLSFSIDDALSDNEKRVYQHRIIAYCRSFGNEHRFTPVIFACRHNDFGTNANNRLTILVGVPKHLSQKFEKRYARWSGFLAAKQLKDDLAIMDEFHQVFSAISSRLHAALPHLPYVRSGLIRGQRTFYSRCLQWKYR